MSWPEKLLTLLALPLAASFTIGLAVLDGNHPWGRRWQPVSAPLIILLIRHDNGHVSIFRCNEDAFQVEDLNLPVGGWARNPN